MFFAPFLSLVQLVIIFKGSLLEISKDGAMVLVHVNQIDDVAPFSTVLNDRYFGHSFPAKTVGTYV
jgi:hypothetical protein